jgi:hypothetical protein
VGFIVKELTAVNSVRSVEEQVMENEEALHQARKFP